MCALNPIPTRSRSSARDGFTYAQVLVLIAMITLIVAALIPSIERMREQANLAICKDNLRRIGAWLLAYAGANGGGLPVSPTVENPHTELLAGLAADRAIADPTMFYCPSERRPELSYSPANFRAGIIGYYYYSAAAASPDLSLSRFLRGGVAWPRMLKLGMSPRCWVASDIWLSGVPTAHAGYRKGVNYLMLDGSVDFVSESPRQHFH
jgi:prepilin-type processing-associated H-X9-DG protein